MAVTQYDLKMVLPNGGIITSTQSYKDSVSSPRSPSGKLVLQSNPFSMSVDRITHVSMNPGYQFAGSDPLWIQPGDANLSRGTSWPPSASFDHVDNMALARFNGKLRKGSASLGVTLASWTQSREMIVKRLSDVRNPLEKAYRRLRGDTRALRHLRHKRDPLANEVLETEFGWRPLFGDIHAALVTVCEDAIPPQWVTGRGEVSVDERFPWRRNGDFVRYKQDWIGTYRTSYGAKVSISNPNLWLLNRLGLINPATVAWDLVPWSFVVNMFVNTNAMLNQFTDEVGLSVSERSITRTRKVIFAEEYQNFVYGDPATYSVEYLRTSKARTLTTALNPVWQVKVPKLNWELALIASSLVVQRVSRLNKLIKGF